MTKIKPKPKIKQVFCNHVYVEAIRATLFHNLNGMRVYEVCEKCGKVRSSYFREED